MGESERPAHADVSPPITSELNHILWQAANPPPFGPGQGNLNRDPDSEVWAGQGRRCRCRNSSDFDVMMMFNCIAIIISNGRPGSWRIGVVWILMSFTCSSSKKPPSFSPSMYYNGFVSNDARCPYLLGKGVGPKPYHHLYATWTALQQEISSIDSIPKEEVCRVRSMLSDIAECEENEMNEGELSGKIAKALQALLQDNVRVVHQFKVPGTAFTIDVAICRTTGDAVDAALEVKWSREKDKFPESQASAYAYSVSTSRTDYISWLPVFVLSQNHYQIGVAFGSIANRWAYSEIFSCSRQFSPDNNEDVAHILRLTRFVVEAADYHRTYQEDRVPLLVATNGEPLLAHPRPIGNRVLQGWSLSNTKKVLKLYASRTAAEQALSKQKAISEILGYDMSAELKEGCDPQGLCSIVDDYHCPSLDITIKHLIDLVRQIKLLQENRFIHGDLRVPNILFCEKDRAILIDFDWSGRFGAVSFPVLVRRESFGPQAQLHVAPNLCIPPDFDWLCLADILCSLGFQRAARAAALGRADSVCLELQQLGDSSDVKSALARLLAPVNPSPRLDLGGLGLRYYLNNTSDRR